MKRMIQCVFAWPFAGRLVRHGLTAMVITVSLINTPLALAGELEQKATTLCEHVRGCVLSEIKKQNLEPSMEAMMTQMMGDQVCKGLMNTQMALDLSQKYKDKDVTPAATACMDSMMALSCTDLIQKAGKTAECEKYEHIFESIRPPTPPVISH